MIPTCPTCGQAWERVCKVCGRKTLRYHSGERCAACFQYFRRNGRECPPEVYTKRKREVVW